ncbi:hypothetical protein HU200_039872 [Digitaria exilis]|uniref:Uncharacterized protein n=1 Tax=Digitaria exilis TaxID=1010633 RepID=A0A835B8S5_9POAL|nr:hypothetical protein HU200_039872 [Digitaria exilis]
MAWRGPATRAVLAAVRRPAAAPAAAAARLRAPPPFAAPRRRVPSAFTTSSSSPLPSARPLAALMGSPVTAAAVMARLTAHPGASARACCELSQGNLLPLPQLLRSIIFILLFHHVSSLALHNLIVEIASFIPPG